MIETTGGVEHRKTEIVMFIIWIILAWSAFRDGYLAAGSVFSLLALASLGRVAMRMRRGRQEESHAASRIVGRVIR